MNTTAEEFIAYSVGLCYASVCTTLRDTDEIAHRLNTEHPTGIAPWTYSGEAFRTGQPNPCPCSNHPETHQHYLLSC